MEMRSPAGLSSISGQATAYATGVSGAAMQQSHNQQSQREDQTEQQAPEEQQMTSSTSTHTTTSSASGNYSHQQQQQQQQYEAQMGCWSYESNQQEVKQQQQYQDQQQTQYQIQASPMDYYDTTSTGLCCVSQQQSADASSQQQSEPNSFSLIIDQSGAELISSLYDEQDNMGLADQRVAYTTASSHKSNDFNNNGHQHLSYAPLQPISVSRSLEPHEAYYRQRSSCLATDQQHQHQHQAHQQHHQTFSAACFDGYAASNNSSCDDHQQHAIYQQHQHQHQQHHHHQVPQASSGPNIEPQHLYLANENHNHHHHHHLIDGSPHEGATYSNIAIGHHQHQASLQVTSQRIAQESPTSSSSQSSLNGDNHDQQHNSSSNSNSNSNSNNSNSNHHHHHHHHHHDQKPLINYSGGRQVQSFHELPDSASCFTQLADLQVQSRQPYHQDQNQQEHRHHNQQHQSNQQCYKASQSYDSHQQHRQDDTMSSITQMSGSIYGESSEATSNSTPALSYQTPTTTVIDNSQVIATVYCHTNQAKNRQQHQHSTNGNENPFGHQQTTATSTTNSNNTNGNISTNYTTLNNCDNYLNQLCTTTTTTPHLELVHPTNESTQNRLRLLKSRRGRPRKKGQRSKSKVNGKLWEFIRDLLLNERTNPSFIRWERREDGVFKFVQSDKVAKMWGERKQNPKMTYEKLSRAMRYYYKSKVLLPVFGRRLVYKFGPNATGWMPI